MSDDLFPTITSRAAVVRPTSWAGDGTLPTVTNPVSGPLLAPSAPAPNRSRPAVKRREPVRYPGNLAASLADVRMMLRAVDDAMSAENIPAETRRRVVDRVLWGEPDGL